MRRPKLTPVIVLALLTATAAAGILRNLADGSCSH